MPTFSVLDDIVLKPPVSKTKAAALEDEIVGGGCKTRAAVPPASANTAAAADRAAAQKVEDLQVKVQHAACNICWIPKGPKDPIIRYLGLG